MLKKNLNNDNLVNDTKITLDLFNEECEKMKSMHEYPLFLIEHLGLNNYLAWSLNEYKFVFLSNFKSFHNNFYVADVIADETDISFISNTKYGITPPSDALISSMDLNLFPSVWNSLLPFDSWIQREPMVPKLSFNDKKVDSIYKNAIDLINEGRSHYQHDISNFSHLEDCIVKLERLIEYESPADIIQSQFNRISHYCKIVENNLA